MNAIDQDDKDLVDEYYKINARDFFVATQVLKIQILKLKMVI